MVKLFCSLKCDPLHPTCVNFRLASIYGSIDVPTIFLDHSSAIFEKCQKSQPLFLREADCHVSTETKAIQENEKRLAEVHQDGAWRATKRFRVGGAWHERGWFFKTPFCFFLEDFRIYLDVE